MRNSRDCNATLQIGNLSLKNWLILAPMAGITNLPFRLMVKKLGAGLVTSEMISATGLTLGQKRTFDYLISHLDEKPLAIQIFGARPEAMAEAARIAADAGADIVDINLGCPVKKVLKTGAGGALLRDPQLVARIVSAVRRACPVPLTVKTRAGWSPNHLSAWEMARILETCGVDAITVHARFVIQGFSGPSDWTIIASVKEQVTIPVIGNGDVFRPSLALEMRTQTACDGVMIGRGAIGNPWIFQQIMDMENGLAINRPELDERKALIMEHFRLLCDFMGDDRAAKTMRGLLLWYTKGLPHSSRFRGAITRIKDLGTLIAVLDHYFSSLIESDQERPIGAPHSDLPGANL
jgi:tRNA-dihydrouridine synthase B